MLLKIALLKSGILSTAIFSILILLMFFYPLPSNVEIFSTSMLVLSFLSTTLFIKYLKNDSTNTKVWDEVKSGLNEDANFIKFVLWVFSSLIAQAIFTVLCIYFIFFGITNVTL